ncbi:GNAT family N-acetyltransferase [Phaeodactylibacter xiamenensis]|uniref:GNAT family N-acetyltransferase n=1 Tax=Phaeodactylibacter xiamenensis TaxID=1524460 RepID=UPI003BA901AA
MSTYKVLSSQSYVSDPYRIVPIRMEDRYDIMKWRNEQIYHLRQDKVLTKESQDYYFSNVVSTLFDQDFPSQILFSYLDEQRCIGYGGLVHINWMDRNAEISFIIDTKLEKHAFHHHWSKYLALIEKVGFEDLKLHKLYVYAFDLRPHLYEALEYNNYFMDARLKDHCLLDGTYTDIVIHAKINPTVWR